MYIYKRRKRSSALIATTTTTYFNSEYHRVTLQTYNLQVHK